MLALNSVVSVDVFKDKPTISSQIIVEILDNTPD